MGISFDVVRGDREQYWARFTFEVGIDVGERDGGNGIECLICPFDPAIGKVMRKYRNVSTALVGTHFHGSVVIIVIIIIICLLFLNCFVVTAFMLPLDCMTMGVHWRSNSLKRIYK